MPRVAVLCIAVLAAATTVAGQQPSVDVASIKRNVAAGGPRLPNVVWLAGDRTSATGLTLAELIRSAYVGDGIQLMNQIAGSPGWTTTGRFDIVGKLTGIQTGKPDEVNRQRQAALKKMLADRFGLKAHVEKRELPVFDLVLAAKDGKLGPEIKESTCGAHGNRPCILADDQDGSRRGDHDGIRGHDDDPVCRGARVCAGYWPPNQESYGPLRHVRSAAHSRDSAGSQRDRRLGNVHGAAGTARFKARTPSRSRHVLVIDRTIGNISGVSRVDERAVIGPGPSNPAATAAHAMVSANGSQPPPGIPRQPGVLKSSTNKKPPFCRYARSPAVSRSASGSPWIHEGRRPGQKPPRAGV